MYISSAFYLLLALPAALAAPASGLDNSATSVERQSGPFKREYCVNPTPAEGAPDPVIVTSDVLGLIDDIHALGDWSTLVPLAGTHLITNTPSVWILQHGTAEICIYNDWWFENTHLSMGEAAWVVDWIAFTFCPTTL
jgi:hypothetical protein